MKRAQTEQPHWITPVATVTPRLEQEFRYDLAWQAPTAGGKTVNYGGGKGLELIPTRRIEVIFGVPAYIVHSQPDARDGAGDLPFLVKYRLVSRNETTGNYIVTAFLGGTVPTGSYKNGAEHGVITPTIAGGKGWGNFSIQNTFGIAIPTGEVGRLGAPLLENAALQYRILKKLWPEVEVNSTFWANGSRAGRKQVFLTPGLVIGRIRLAEKVGLTVGVGFQTAVTSYHLYNHNWILSVRLPFS